MRRIIPAILLATVVLFSVGASYVSVARAQASEGVLAPHSNMVQVAVDVTSTSACQVTYHLTISRHGTVPRSAPSLEPWIKTIPCPVGTILTTATVPLSQALAQHKRYMSLPAHPQAPTAAERTAIRAFLDAQHATLSQKALAQVAAPTPACNSPSYAYLQFQLTPPNGPRTGFYSQVWWYRNCGSANLNLDEDAIGPGWYPYIADDEYWYWDWSAYNNDQWPVNQELLPNTNYQEYPNKWEPTNHWLRQYPSWNDPPYSYEADINIALLN